MFYVFKDITKVNCNAKNLKLKHEIQMYKIFHFEQLYVFNFTVNRFFGWDHGLLKGKIYCYWCNLWPGIGLEITRGLLHADKAVIMIVRNGELIEEV